MTLRKQYKVLTRLLSNLARDLSRKCAGLFFCCLIKSIYVNFTVIISDSLKCDIACALPFALLDLNHWFGFSPSDQNNQCSTTLLSKIWDKSSKIFWLVSNPYKSISEWVWLIIWTSCGHTWYDLSQPWAKFKHFLVKLWSPFDRLPLALAPSSPYIRWVRNGGVRNIRNRQQFGQKKNQQHKTSFWRHTWSLQLLQHVSA